MHEGDTEYDVAIAVCRGAPKVFMPLIGDSLAYVLAMHLREQIRHDAFGLAEVSSGRAASADEVTVCFADMVDFTQLGETLDPEALGTSPGGWASCRCRRRAPGPPGQDDRRRRDDRRTRSRAGARSRRSRSWKPLRTEGEDFPLLRAGVATGMALPRSGDWYGRPVNIASRDHGDRSSRQRARRRGGPRRARGRLRVVVCRDPASSRGSTARSRSFARGVTTERPPGTRSSQRWFC